MRVWMINHYAISPQQPGGTRHFSMAQELVKRGHEVFLLASSFSHATRTESLRHDEQARIEVVDGAKFVWIRTPAYSGNTVARLWNMLAFAFRVCTSLPGLGLERPDVVIGSSPHLFAAWAAKHLARKLSVPFVLEVRDLWPQSFVDLGVLSPKNPLVLLFGFMERKLYSQAGHIITLLPGSVDHMVAKGARREKVTWIPNGIDLDLVGDVAPPTASPMFRVLYAGAHGHANGLDAIVDAAGHLAADPDCQHIRIRMIGDGPEKERLRQRILAEKLTNVSMEPPVPKTQVYTVMRDADAFVVTLKDSPLYRWGISLNKLYDYLACGRPIVFGSGSAYNPVAEAGAGIVVAPEDASAIAAGIKELAGLCSESRAEMGRRGRAYVECHHSMQVLGDKLEGLLKAMCNNAVVAD